MLKLREIHTQKNNVLKHLESGKEITPLDALEQYGCFRLAAVIWNLRDEGYKIATKTVSNKYGKTFASYKLKDVSTVSK
tara:strand:- start:531 stop:767 length:237 start_codon:yes stop_codon:yes gene_type:complete